MGVVSITGRNRRVILPRWWRRNFLRVELGVAVFVGICAASWGYFLDGNELIREVLGAGRADIYGTLASIFGSLFGFAITATSIVLGFSGSERLAVLRDSPYYQDLWDTFLSTIKWLGIATILALIALVFDRNEASLSTVIYAVFFASVIVTLRLMRSVWILQRVINALTRPSKSSSDD